ncbi:alpha-glucosidase [Algoriphagus faecimaris]|uniref:Alpha-glucosidase n=1 Tax=Algoriphagus faecimaris TaxID=686796 RepID=A0A1G6RLA3_9BACT|nr:TIM-barrel domain-containing protein [Algoriphagus faecimaris]SDD05422.1 alpha-glucosidase [Algoriphagus faecimaris]
MTHQKSSATHLGIGKVINWEQFDQGIKGSTALGYFKITVFEAGKIKVQASRFEEFEINPYSVIESPEFVTFSVKSDSKKIQLITGKIKAELILSSFQIRFLDLEGNLLNEDDSLGIAWIGTEVSCYKKVQPEEKFIGLGEKTGNLNRAGSAYTNWNTDYFAYGVNDDPLYMSIPFYIGIHQKGAYGIYLDNTHKTVFNFGASTNRFIYFSAEDGDMSYFFIYENTIPKIISSYTKLTGRMELPPLWSLGFQQCRYSYYPDSEVITLAKTFRDKDMPADVIYLDIHHMEEYKVFTFDGKKFPDPKRMIAELKAKGFKVVVIMDPGIKAKSDYLPYSEGKKKGLFVKYPDGEEYQGQVWPGWCAFPDFTAEKTRAWWAEKMAYYTEAGVDGFWTDMNEPASWGQFTPNLLEFSYEGEKVSHRKARNIYGMQMARSAQEGAVINNKDKRPFVLTRSGFAGIQRHAAAWTGDNVASEEHMLAGVRLVNSLGISGVAFSGYDVGGFAGESSKSLFARWMSIGAFAPLYRAHSMINSNDAEPWAFGEEVEEISRNYMKLRYQLLPTLYSKFFKASLDGLPVASSLAINYPLDPKIYQTAYQNQYLFCDSFMVAPVESTREIAKVYLPEGSWYFLYSDSFYPGNQEIYLDTPLNYLPVLVKGGSIFTMQSTVSHTQEQHNGILSLHLYKGEKENEFLHYEDDGESFDYQEMNYHKRNIRYSPSEMQLNLEEATGNFGSKFHSIRLYLHGFKTEVISVNGVMHATEKKDFAFLGKLTEFDPLPEHEHPFYQIKGLSVVEFKNSNQAIEITGLL